MTDTQLPQVISELFTRLVWTNDGCVQAFRGDEACTVYPDGTVRSTARADGPFPRLMFEVIDDLAGGRGWCYHPDLAVDMDHFMATGAVRDLKWADRHDD